MVYQSPLWVPADRTTRLTRPGKVCCSLSDVTIGIGGRHRGVEVRSDGSIRPWR